MKLIILLASVITLLTASGCAFHHDRGGTYDRSYRSTGHYPSTTTYDQDHHDRRYP